jgi:hypothetical protein
MAAKKKATSSKVKAVSTKRSMKGRAINISAGSRSRGSEGLPAGGGGKG